jgi:carbon-monoxide dehydrogenase large subunit
VRECLDKAADWVEWSDTTALERGPWRRGKGIAVGCKQTARGPSVVSVKVHEDATLEVRHSALEQGMGCHTALAQIAAEEFNTSVDKVKIVAADTAITGFEFGTLGQRITIHTGNALVLACRDAKRQIFELASTKLGVPPEGLDIGEGKVYVKGVPERAVRVTELFTPLGYLLKGGELIGRGVYISTEGSEDLQTGQGKGTLLYGYYASAAEVAVHEETGEVKLLRVGICADTGQPINPKLCEAQVDRGISWGIGTAFFEEMVIDKGQLTTTNFMDYKLPTSLDVPANKDSASLIAWVPYTEGPFSAKGFAEGTMVPVAPAISNAIHNAVRVRMKDLPITREKLLKALKER